MITSKTIFAVFLGMVIFTGSIPFSFAENEMASNMIQSPKKQIESGVLPEDVQCMQDKVLVMRDNNGRVACVKEETAKKIDWEIISHTFKVISLNNNNNNNNDNNNTQGQSSNTINIFDDVEISTNRITVVGGDRDRTQSDVYSTVAPTLEQSWTTLTYPEEFKIGKPFIINYTWTFLKSYSEANGDEWPQDNLEKYPWAQEWTPYQEGEDKNGKDWWKIKRGHEHHPGTLVKIYGVDEIQVLTKEFTLHDWKGRPHFPLVEGYLDKERIHPWDLKEHSASVTLQIDKPISPPTHSLAFTLGETKDGLYPLYVHFNNGVGYLGPSAIKWFASDTSNALALAEEDLSNPYSCWTDKEWNGFSDEQKRWDLLYPAYECKLAHPDVKYNIPTDDERLIGWKDWLDRNNITENIREYLSEQITLGTDEIDRFFEKYPHLKGLFVLPSFLPEAFATHGSDHLIIAFGTFLVSDLHGNVISPIGSSVCLYDQMNNGKYVVLKNGKNNACVTMKKSTGEYAVVAVNTDPDDNSGVDLIVGLKSENDIIKVTNYGANKTENYIDHNNDGILAVNEYDAGKVIVAHAPVADISYNVPKNADTILKLPKVTLNSSSEFSRAYYFTDKIYNAFNYIKDNFSTNISQITVEYESNPMPPHKGDYYLRGNSVIDLGPTSYASDFIILHEYGHHVMNSVYHDNKGDFPNSPGGSHGIERANTNHELVWSEGWANYFVTLVNNSAIVNTYYIFNFESRTFDILNTPFDSGDLVEGNIAAVLWDLTDGLGERNRDRAYQDTISNLKQNIWNIFDSPAPNTSTAPQETFADFITQWEQTYPEHDINKVLLLNTYIDKLPDPKPKRTGSILFSEPFETDLSKWNLSGDDDWDIQRYMVSRPSFAEGSQFYLQKVANGDNCDDTCIMTLKSNIDLSNYHNINLSFHYMIDSAISDDEGLKIEATKDGGTTWTVLKEWNKFDGDDLWHITFPVFDLSSYATSQFNLKITSTTSSSKEDIQIGQLEIRGTENIKHKSKPARVFTSHTPVVTANNVSISWDEPTSSGTPLLEYDIQRLDVGTSASTTGASASTTGASASTTGASASTTGASASTTGASSAPNSFITIATVSAGTTIFVDDTISGNTSYEYKIRGKNSEGYGAFSNVISVTTPNSNTVPNPPTNLIAIAVSDRIIDLSWVAPQNNGGSNVTGYDIERNLKNAGFTTLVNNTNSTLSKYSDSTLSSSDTASYRISAINDVGTGTPSNVSAATTFDTTPPVITAPVNITKEATTVTLTKTTIVNATATDNSPLPIVITHNATVSIKKGFPLGITVINWTATDTAGNTASANQLVTIKDTISPKLNTTPGITTEATAIKTFVTIPVPYTYDIFPITLTNDTLTAYSLGITLVNFTATDTSNNITTNNTKITINDTISPNITIPGNYIAEATTLNTPLTQSDYGSATATDIFSIIITSNATGIFPLGNTIINWTATDTSNNGATAYQSILVRDTTPPTITPLTSQVIEATGVSTPLPSLPIVSDLVDSDPTITNNATTSSFALGKYTILWTVTDDYSNDATAHQSITIQDTTPPTVTAPKNMTFNATGTSTLLSKSDYGFANATDLVDSNPTITNNATSSFALGNTIISWNATDALGNFAVAHQRITVNNNTVSSANGTLFNNIFTSDLEGWDFYEKPNTVANKRYCNTQNTNVYSLTHSSEHKGSAFTNYSNTCWFGLAGGTKSFTVPSQFDGHSLSITLDYKSLANLKNFGHIGHVNNMFYVISDSEKNIIKNDIIFLGKIRSAIQDTTWKNHSINIPSINSNQCPCEIFIYTADSWTSEWQKRIYFDNVNATMSTIASASSLSNTVHGMDVLTQNELFSMMLSNGTKILINTKQVHDNSIFLDWDSFGDGNTQKYKVVLNNQNNTSDDIDFSDVVVGSTEYRFVNLEPDIIYEIRVGLGGGSGGGSGSGSGKNGDNSTQSIVYAKTLSNGSRTFENNISLQASSQMYSDNITLQWNDLNNIGQNLYKIERSVDGGVSYQLISAQPSKRTDRMIQDTIQSDWLGKVISYKVFEMLGSQKLYSDKISVTLPTNLESPQNLKTESVYVEGAGSAVKITWDDTSLFHNYVIEKQNKDGNWDMLGKIKTNSFEYTGETKHGDVIFRVFSQLGDVKSTASTITHD